MGTSLKISYGITAFARYPILDIGRIKACLEAFMNCFLSVLGLEGGFIGAIRAEVGEFLPDAGVFAPRTWRCP
jgi:hypothetical protein